MVKALRLIMLIFCTSDSFIEAPPIFVCAYHYVFNSKYMTPTHLQQFGHPPTERENAGIQICAYKNKLYEPKRKEKKRKGTFSLHTLKEKREKKTFCL